MKILFIIQGEGRGHLTQALSLRQKLMAEGHEIVGVLVGKVRPAVCRIPPLSHYLFLSATLEGFRNSAVFWKESWQEGKHLLLFLPVRL